MHRPCPFRRAGSRLFALAAAVSLAACIATCVLWARSAWVADKMGYVRAGLRDDWFVFESYRGTVWCGYTSSRPVADGAPGNGWLWQTEVVQPSYPDRERFAFVYDSREGNAYSTAVIVPHWLILAATALTPAATLLRALRLRRRRRRGCCLGCGYDLRATRDRCPECGKAAAR